MKVKIEIQWENRDKKGKLLSRSKKIRANSLVRSFVDGMYVHMAQATFTNGMIDVAGTTRSPSAASVGFATNDVVNSSAFGLVVGTGTNAVAVTDTSLQTQIAHGNGGGQLAYGAVTFTAPGTAGSTRSFTIQRTYTNNSGSDIIVKEVGIYSKVSATFYYLMDRTLSTRTITNGTSGTLTYTISVTV